MFPSIFLLPVPMVGLAACNRLCGPMPTIRLCSRLSNTILEFTDKQNDILPDDVQFELSVVRRLMPRRIAACLEMACAMQIWLAFHGCRAKVALGKRVENGQILAHAWLETRNGHFFFDDRFVPFAGNTKNLQNA